MATPPGLTVRDNEDEHRFEIDLGDGSFAIAEYKLVPGSIVFTHTQVPHVHEGHGFGTKLVQAGLASARARRLNVIPICPFVRAYLQKHPEEQDLLNGHWREKLGIA